MLLQVIAVDSVSGRAPPSERLGPGPNWPVAGARPQSGCDWGAGNNANCWPGPRTRSKWKLFRARRKLSRPNIITFYLTQVERALLLRNNQRKLLTQPEESAPELGPSCVAAAICVADSIERPRARSNQSRGSGRQIQFEDKENGGSKWSPIILLGARFRHAPDKFLRVRRPK